MLTNNTDNQPLISVVMSNHNTPLNFLKKSINSILNQTYSNFEFIIVDDASTDDSVEIIKSFNDPRIKLICNKQNLGLTRSLNKAFSICKGKYIARMDSDDVSFPKRFEKQLEFMENNKNTIVCGTWAEVIDEADNLRSWEFKHETIEDMDSYRIRLLFSNNPLLLHPSAFFNRNLLLKYNISYDEQYEYAQDYQMWVNCSTHANCNTIQEYLLQYRTHRLAASESKRDMQDFYACQIIQKQLDSLHLTLTDETRPIHFRMLTRLKPYDSKTKQWIVTLIKANKKYKVYNQKKLKKILWYRWSEFCYEELSHSSKSKIISIFLSLSLRNKINLFKIKWFYMNKKNKK